MGVDFYACANCEETFPDCGDYVSCEQCYRHYCCSECADFTPITPVTDSSEEDDDDDDYEEEELQCGVCSKTTPDYLLILKSLCKHFKITMDDAQQIWKDDKEEEE